MKTAYIFDFDGVLAKTMEAHFACCKQALAEVGVPIDREIFFVQAGMTGREMLAYFIAKAGRTIDVETVYRRKGELYGSYTHEVSIIEGNRELLRLLRANGNPVAIASGSSMPSISPVMERYGIEVDAIATSADVKRGKPNPDLFLKAAEKLGVPPETCVVIEDSEVGIEAAQRAGMRAMRFYDLRLGPEPHGGRQDGGSP